MKIEIIKNGTIKLVLIPEDAFDTAALESLGKVEIEAQEFNSQTQVLDNYHTKGLIIKAKSRNLNQPAQDDSNETIKA